MRRLMGKIGVLIVGLCLAYWVLVAVSFYSMIGLPSHGSYNNWENFCYRTDALIVYVECRDHVPFAGIKSLFLNLWAPVYYGFTLLGWAFSQKSGIVWNLLATVAIAYLPAIILLCAGCLSVRKWLIRKK